jgi:hypothetical protein
MSRKYLPVAVAIQAETGCRMHPSTCWRWSSRGSRGIVLKTWLIGGRRMTTVEEVRAFLNLLNAGDAADDKNDKTRRELAAELGDLPRD